LDDDINVLQSEQKQSSLLSEEIQMQPQLEIDLEEVQKEMDKLINQDQEQLMQARLIPAEVEIINKEEQKENAYEQEQQVKVEEAEEKKVEV